jgi:hypothetical protein
MPLQATSGAASYDAFGGGGAAVPQYIEDVFSTWLYDGNSTSGGTQVITNNIDLSAKGGMTWIKGRNSATTNALFDTVRGAGTGSAVNLNKGLASNSTTAEGLGATSDYLSAFSTTGFSVTQGGSVLAQRCTNYTGATYASWTFRKQPKFFDVVTFTTPASGDIVVPHSLGSTPGCVMTKAVSITQGWIVNHRSLSSTNYLALNTTAAQQAAGLTYSADANNVTFQAGYLTASTAYVMYLYAHNAGGFGLTGTDNVISCGTFTSTSGGGANVTIGFEPQWILFKRTNGTGNWYIIDNTRGWTLSATATSLASTLLAESSAAEGALAASLNSTGFKVDASNLAGSAPHIYIAIRRGPMKVPTSGTSVLGLNARTGTGAVATVTGSAGMTDLAIIKNRGTTALLVSASRLTGTGYVVTSSAASEVAAAVSELQANPWDVMDGIKVGTTSAMTNASANTFINYLFKRAPSFMDVVCYTGLGSNTTITHNLGVVPELMIVKGRLGATAWQVYASALANTEYVVLNTTAAKATGATRWNSTTPTSSVFSIGTATEVNTSTETYIAYLFSTCAGVSKVGSYTGTATTLQVNCGFTAGARFVLIKRTDSTGDWYVWDTARGIVSGNDPYLLLNDRAAEVTSTDYIDTYSAGFEISSTAPAAINASGGTFIFLAIA